MESTTGYSPMESILPEKTAPFVARLQIGANEPGRIQSKLEDDEQVGQFGEMIAEHVHEPTVTNTADCIDERLTIRLANGQADPRLLSERLVYQLPGGLYLAVTKAMVAANAAYLARARNIREAYEMTDDLLTGFGFVDGGHAVCGASTLVEKSVALQPHREILLPTVNAIIAINRDKERQFDEIQKHKQRRLEEGFYGGWNPSWHEKRLADRVPQNFSYLATQPDEVHGHYGDGIVVIDAPGKVFAKNEFTNTTGKSAFAATMPIADRIAGLAAGTEEEKSRIQIAFRDDLVIVGHQLLAKDFPAYAIAA